MYIVPVHMCIYILFVAVCMGGIDSQSYATPCIHLHGPSPPPLRSVCGCQTGCLLPWVPHLEACAVSCPLEPLGSEGVPDEQQRREHDPHRGERGDRCSCEQSACGLGCDAHTYMLLTEFRSWFTFTYFFISSNGCVYMHMY